MLWRVLTGDSYWASFIRLKYLTVNFNMSSYSPGLTASHYWRSLSRHFPFIQEQSRWRVDEGKISFWYTNWSGLSSLYNQGWLVIELMLQLKDICAKGTWNIDLIDRLGGGNLVAYIHNLAIRLK